MPTLFRGRAMSAGRVARAAGAALALVFLVKPTPGEIVVPVSIEDRLKSADKP